MQTLVVFINSNFNCYHGNILQSNNGSTKNLTQLTSALLGRQCIKVSLALCFAPLK